MTTETHRMTHDRQIDKLVPDWGWKGLAALGAVMLLGGFVAFLNPFAASLTVEVVAGAAFLLAGAIQILLAVTDDSQTRGGRWLSGALGTALVLLAVSLVLNPLAGLVTLTLMVAILFAVLGSLRMTLAWRMRPNEGWGWIMASGVLSIILAAVIVIGLPGAALGLLGLFLGIDLTASGVVTLSLAMRRRAQGKA